MLGPQTDEIYKMEMCVARQTLSGTSIEGKVSS